jgi:hypothetical protein
MEEEHSLAAARGKFKPTEIRVDNGDPFLNDKLNRQKEIENLSNLLLNSEAPLVLAIDAPWGSGKTTFQKMWKAYLSKEYGSHATIYFSAWETDLSDDPLYVFLGEMNAQLASVATGITRIKWEKALSLAGQITKRSLPALAKLLTYGVLDLKESGIERTLADLSGEVVSETLDAYKASVTAIQQFKENLTDVLKESGNNNPVIVFVDELDRCRPQYAIALLERVKHLLNLPNLFFVLGIDRMQLANAIRGAYGERFDAETYLQRFIDLDYQLPVRDPNAFIQNLVMEYGLDAFFEGRRSISNVYIRNESQNLNEICIDLAKLFNLQLREIEQLLARVNIVARSTEASQPIYPHLLIGLLVLRAKVPDLYLSLINPKGSSIDFLDLITQKWESQVLDSADNIGILIALVIQVISDRNAADPGVAHVTARCTAAEGISAAESNLMSSAALYIRQVAAQPSMRIHLDGLIQRIEMAGNFLV